MTSFTQDTNRYTTLFFANDTDTWHVKAGVVLAVPNGNGVESDTNANKLVNHGYISSGNLVGVDFSGGVVDAKIINASDGEIVGYTNGTVLYGSGTISNAGSVKGLLFAGIELDTTGHAEIDNTGDIFGAVDGIKIDRAVGGASIQNDGIVRSASFGVYLDDAQTTLSIANGVHGTIKAPDGIRSQAGSVVLDNDGKVTGDIDFAAPGAADTIRNHGKIAGESSLGSGADRFDGHDGTQGGVFGQAGNDVIIGGAKADFINGGLGKDTLTGNGGADTFDFDSLADSSVGPGSDLIKDFSQGQHDRIDLSGIDADPSTVPDDAFVFRGMKAFNGAGQVRYVLNDKAGTHHDTTTIYVNVDADLAPDMQIEVKGLIHFHTGDFVL